MYFCSVDTKTGRKVNTMMVKMSSAALCTSSMTGEDGMMTTVTNHLVTSAKDVSTAIGI